MFIGFMRHFCEVRNVFFFCVQNNKNKIKLCLNENERINVYVYRRKSKVKNLNANSIAAALEQKKTMICNKIKRNQLSVVIIRD